jgi:tetratricopeptide (TPR) repeat protein
LRTGRHDEARRFFKSAYDRLPQYFLAAEHLAETEALLGNHAAALALYDEVIKATRLPEFIAARAGVLRDMGRAEEAARALQTADKRWRALVAKFGPAVSGHAVDFWLEDLPRPADAMTWADLSLKARRNPGSLVLAARAAAAVKDPTRARKLLAEVEKSPLRVDEFYTGVADAWHRLGEADKAAEWLAKARELNPKAPGL